MSQTPIPLAPPESFATRLAAYPPERLLTTQDLMWIFDVTDDSITRAVKRGDLPPPTRLFSQHVWHVGALYAHVHGRLQAACVAAAKEDAKRDAKVKALYGG